MIGATDATGYFSVATARGSALARRIEDSVLVLAQLAIVGLPLSEALLRRLAATGITGSSAIVQHLTLAASLVGASVAARDGKLLMLFDFTALASRRVREIGRWGSALLGAVVAALLAVSGWKLMATERSTGRMLVDGLPLWTIQALLPAAFALIAIRLLWQIAPSPGARALALVALAALLATAAAFGGHVNDGALGPMVLLALLAAAAGMPVFAVLGAFALLLVWRREAPIASLALDHYRLVVHPTLPAIPLFTLAGYLLAASGAPVRLTRLFQALFGQVRGGIAIAAAIVSAFFTAFTGASGVTILALGGLLMPLLTMARYRERDVLGLVTSAGSLGAILAPALPLVLYAIVARVPIAQMFLGALLPAAIQIGLMAWWGARREPPLDRSITSWNLREIRNAALAAKWEIALPAVAFISLFGGFATPVEAAALTALYVLVVETLVHRDLRDRRRLIAVFTDCGAMIGGILLILGVSMGLTDGLIDAEIPDRAVAWVSGAIHSRWLFLLALNGLLLLVGCLMEIFAAIVVVAPLVVPLGNAFGIDPVHLGVVFLANLELGFLTPLVGVNLLYASSRFNRPIVEVGRSILPFLAPLVASVLAITYLPWLSTALPGALR
jgi:C4-dicarboxylate transporter DctM subunit